MRYLSLCSGIEAATVAWKPLGWTAVGFSEIEPFPCSVLSHHYPDVPNLGNMLEITSEQIERVGPVDLLVGGTPCQSFSIAGLRGGLADARGNLALRYCQLLACARPRWFVWENVPGVLSSNKGRDFGAIVGAMAELGYGWAYRVLDAQFFGVPQRRRRVFIVGHLGDWRRAGAVLFEPESLRGDSSESRQAGKDVTGTLSSRPSAGGGLGTDFDLAGGVLASTGNISHCLNAGGMGRIDYETETLVTAFSCKDHAGDAGGKAPTLRAMGHGGSHANAGGQVAIVAFDTTQITSPGNFSNPQPGDACHPLAADAHPPTVCTFQPRIGRNGRGYSEDVIGTLAGADAGATSDMRPCVTGPLIGPRRLTVTECERLQGFEDNYTLVPHRGRQAADGPRYKAIGNSMAVPVMTWIGRRIAQVDQLVKGP